MSHDRFELPDDAAIDFREAAVRESMRMVECNRGLVPENCSLCLPVTDSDPDAMRGYGLGVLAIFVVGLLCIVGGGVFALVAAKLIQDHAERSWLAVIPLVVPAAGFALLLSQGVYQRRFARRQIGARYENLLTLGGQPKPVCVGLEEAVSFHRFKLTPDDVAFVACDPIGRRVIIEGVRHRYWIQGDDVLSVGQLPGGSSTATAIAYAVGAAQLAIALQQTSIWHEFKKQTIGAKRDPLLRVIQDTLGQRR
jgi:hypothetical protein